MLFFLTSENLFAENNSEKLKYYLDQANVAFQNKDYYFACELSETAVKFSGVAESGVYYNQVKNFSEKMCESKRNDEKQKQQEKTRLCLKYKNAQQSCAIAGNYDLCIKITLNGDLGFLPYMCNKW